MNEGAYNMHNALLYVAAENTYYLNREGMTPWNS